MSGGQVDLCVFAHNEESVIATTMAAIAQQSLLRDPRWDVRVALMANACTDETVARAGAAMRAMPSASAERFVIYDLRKGGKSRTWNVFTHQVAREDALALIYMDADIRLVSETTLEALVLRLQARPALTVFSSRPVKDITHDDTPVSPVARLIARSGGGLDDFRTAICGQLYAIRPETARAVHMPVGLPVEDGFLRAMVLTDFLSRPEDMARIDADPEIFHVYESLRAIGPLVRHQVRVVIGGAINAVIFAVIRRDTEGREGAQALLANAAGDEGWLSRLLRAELPRAPFGYIPFHFAVKRLGGPRRPGFGGLAILAVGVAFDATVWILASIRMTRGAGAGYW